MCFICVEDEVEQLTIGDRFLVSKGSECCATNMLNSQPSDVDEDNLCHSLVDNSEILSVKETTFDEPCCKADASDTEEEGLDECGVFAIPKYQLSQSQSANEELQSLTMCLQCKTAQIQSMFLPCHHIIHSRHISVFKPPHCTNISRGAVRERRNEGLKESVSNTRHLLYHPSPYYTPPAGNHEGAAAAALTSRQHATTS